MPAPLRVLLALALPALAAAQPVPAPAEHEPETVAFRYSAYEDATIAGALAALGLDADDSPEGKQVESLHAVRLEVVEARDPAPRFVNVFHVTTRADVVLRESLLRPGEPFRRALADETRRNLAAAPQLSLALVFAARGSAPDRTRVVLVTKDVWSLRLNWDVALSGSGLERLSAAPSETNFLGTHQTVGLLVGWLPLSWSLGAQVEAPRVGGSHVGAAAEAGIILATSGGAREGSFGSAQVVSPLWSSRTEWAWGAGASWLEETTRRYTRGTLARFTLDPAGCAAPSPTCIPWAWRSEVAAASAFVTRSYGWAVKHDLSAGVEARRSRFSPQGLEAADLATVQAFRATRVPVGDDRVGPFLQYRTYTTDFLRVLDLDTLALQEDWRLGPQASLRVQPLARALGSSRDLVALSGGASWAIPLRDGLARAGVAATAEVETAGGAARDGSLQGSLGLATPRARAGRIVVQATALDRWANSLHRLSALGGDTRLRGWPSDAFVGAHLLAANVEARSRPLQLLESLQLGAVAFYDAGNAFDRWRGLELRHSVGLGARALFPQLDRIVLRADVGFPVAGTLPAGASRAAFYVTFGQAFAP